MVIDIVIMIIVFIIKIFQIPINKSIKIINNKMLSNSSKLLSLKKKNNLIKRSIQMLFQGLNKT